MPVSKKRKKIKKRSNKNNTEKIIGSFNQPTLANKLYRVDNSLFEEHSFEELIEVCNDTVLLVKEEYKDIEVSEVDCKRFAMLLILNAVYGKLEKANDIEASSLVKIEYDNCKCFIDIHRYIHETENTLIISEINYITTSRNGECIQPLVAITQLADALDVDLVFPAYEKNDPQETMFNSFGFVDSEYQADVGQKILYRKARRELIDKILNTKEKDDKVDLNKYYPLESDKDTIYLKRFNEQYAIMSDRYNSELNSYIPYIDNKMNDAYCMAQYIYESSRMKLNDYIYKEVRAERRMPLDVIESTFRRIYPDHQEFDKKTYDRLFEGLMMSEKYHIIHNI